MLKRKLHKAALIIGSFVFMAASSDTTARTSRNDNSAFLRAIHDSLSLLTHTFDSSGYCICLPVDEAHEMDNAPRITLNKYATQYVKDHHKKNGMLLDKIKTEREARFTLIDSVFTKHMLPVELKYLAVIESQLNTRAVSRVGAKGMWQFMPSTARLCGLTVKGKYDERLYAYKSTVAAAKYLTYLYRLFDDWLLTIAAYNSGPGYVYAAIKKSGSRNFWVLQRFLPTETRNHVKKFISVHYYYEGHGSMTTITKAERLEHFDAVARFIEKQKTKEEDETTEEPVTIATETVKISQE